MSDDGWPTTKRFHRDMQSAFGPYTSREIETDEPAPAWRVIAIEALYYIAAAALIAAVATAPRWWPVALHP